MTTSTFSYQWNYGAYLSYGVRHFGSWLWSPNTIVLKLVVRTLLPARPPLFAPNVAHYSAPITGLKP
jgi:hypothetical protein